MCRRVVEEYRCGDGSWIIGGDAASMSAAAQARRSAKPETLEIVAFERGTYTAYAACGLPYLVGGFVTAADKLVAGSRGLRRAGEVQ